MQTWEKTSVQCLVRHSISETYYARVRAGGKLIWRTLKTDQFIVAKARLPETVAQIRKGSLAPPLLKPAMLPSPKRPQSIFPMSSAKWA